MTPITAITYYTAASEQLPRLFFLLDLRSFNFICQYYELDKNGKHIPDKVVMVILGQARFRRPRCHPWTDIRY